MNRRTVAVVALACLAALGLLEILLGSPGRASLLPALLLWCGLVQGALALTAAADLSGGSWLGPVRDRLLDLAPLTLLFPLVFPLFARDVTGYPWSAHPTPWLEPTFFLIRGTAILAGTAFLALLYARAARAGSGRTGPLAVLYLLGFVLCQSLAAFDWTMSFEHPWISTMLGPLFIVEALMAGIAAITLIALSRAGGDPESPVEPPALRDSATLLFGFSLLWGGLFFGQYLTIWYGNIPEEVSFIARRIATPALTALFVAPVFGLFVVPFLTLMPRKTKTSPPVVTAMSLLVIATVLVQKVVYLRPAAEIPPLPAAAALILLGLPVVLGLRGAQSSRSQ